VLKWAFQMMSLCSEVIPYFWPRFSMPLNDFDPHSDWLKTHQFVSWFRRFFPYLVQFLFQRLPYRIDASADGKGRQISAVDHVIRGIFAQGDDWPAARRL
jgi:hypothetical protein